MSAAETFVLRGPLGTEMMGCSVALPANVTEGWSVADWNRAGIEYQSQLLDMLRRHVGGARPYTEPRMSIEGPYSDPIQGAIHVMSIAAWFNPLDLPPDCTAYRSRGEARGRG